MKTKNTATKAFVLIRMDAKLRLKALKAAKAENRSLAQWLVRLTEVAVDKPKKNQPCYPVRPPTAPLGQP